MCSLFLTYTGKGGVGDRVAHRKVLLPIFPSLGIGGSGHILAFQPGFCHWCRPKVRWNDPAAADDCRVLIFRQRFHLLLPVYSCGMPSLSGGCRKLLRPSSAFVLIVASGLLAIAWVVAEPGRSCGMARETLVAPPRRCRSLSAAPSSEKSGRSPLFLSFIGLPP